MKNYIKFLLLAFSFEMFSNDLLSIYKEALDKDTYLNAVSNATNIILESSLTIDQ